MNLGAWVAFGIAIGTAIFVVLDSPAWIALGAGIGTAIGVAFQGRSGR